MGRLITIRTKQRAFHPNGDQFVLDLSPDVFSVLRVSPEGDQHILSLINVTSRPTELEIPVAQLKAGAVRWYDIVSGMEWEADEGILYVSILPYDIFWLTPVEEVEGISA